MTFFEVEEKDHKPFSGYVSSAEIVSVYEAGSSTLIKTRDGVGYTAVEKLSAYDITLRSGTIIPAEAGYKVLRFYPNDGKDDPKPYSEEPIIAWSIASGREPLPICVDACSHGDWDEHSTILYPNGTVCSRAEETQFESIKDWIKAQWALHDKKQQSKAVSK